MARNNMDQKVQLTANWLLVVTAALVAAGVFMVFNASYVRAHGAQYTNYDSFYFLKRQLVWAGLGILALYIGTRIDHHRIGRYWKPLLLTTIVLLILVLIPGIGKKANGAQRSIGFGPIGLQPAELAKLVIIVYLAHHFARKPFTKWPTDKLLKMLLVTAFVMLLVVVEPDLGTTLALAGTVAVLIYLGGARKRLLFGLAGLGAAGVVLLILIEPYRLGRIWAWLDPWKYYESYGFQVIHSLVALGSGGPFGVGVGRSVQKCYYLPACHTDFIYAIVGEEMGLWGTIGLMGLIGLLCYLGFNIAQRAKSTFGTLLAAGITAQIGLQALLNIAVVSGLSPATGVPLPFISYGGSSLVVTLFSVGILINIARNQSRVQEAEYHESHSNSRGNGRSHLSSPKHRRNSIQSWRNSDSIRRNRRRT